jgi:hypothetical protein
LQRLWLYMIDLVRYPRDTMSDFANHQFLGPLFLAGVAVVVLYTSHAKADDMIIKQPGAHAKYSLELEPHLLLGISNRFGKGKAFGPGVRATIPLMDNGFVSSINNNVGIGFGADVFFHDSKTIVVVPIVMQWNFFLSKNWSVFGEPGGALVFGDGSGKLKGDPILAAGGRFHFSERITLTLRAGYPALSVGASFLF